MIEEVPFVCLLLVADKPWSREIIVLSSLSKANIGLLCHALPALYSKGLCWHGLIRSGWHDLAPLTCSFIASVLSWVCIILKFPSCCRCCSKQEKFSKLSVILFLCLCWIVIKWIKIEARQIFPRWMGLQQPFTATEGFSNAWCLLLERAKGQCLPQHYCHGPQLSAIHRHKERHFVGQSCSGVCKK